MRPHRETAERTARRMLADVRIGLALVLGVTAGFAARAQDPYPSRPIRVVAPFAAGGLVDVLSRAVAEKLRPALGQPVVVDNRPGAGGNIGADVVARADADGYTLLMSSAGILTINQYLYSKMPFDPAASFMPVSLVAEMYMMMVVGPSVPARSVAEFV